MTCRRGAHSILGLALLMAACGPTMDEEIGVNGPDMTWEEFQAQAYHENFEGGVYIVNGDEPILNEKLLREFYDFLYTDNGLIVNRVGGTDDRWNDTAKLNLTFCVSNTFGGNKNAVVSAMNAATGNWEAAANVNFVYHSEFDASCTASQSGVVFDIRPVSGQSYLARSFFPSNGRSSRNVLIDSTAFNTSWTLTNILTHELGHTLGFRHEHVRPEAQNPAATACNEGTEFRTITAYDKQSVMHYPQCNGDAASTLAFTMTDKAGVAMIYGAAGVGGRPVATINQPTEGQIVGQSFKVAASVVDDDIVNAVLKIDGAGYATKTAGPFDFQVSNLAEGAHSLEVIATDMAGGTASMKINVNVMPGASNDITGGCSAGGAGSGLLFGFGLLGAAGLLRRRLQGAQV